MKRLFFDIYKTQEDITSVYVDTCYKPTWQVRQEIEEKNPHCIVVLTKEIELF